MASLLGPGALGLPMYGTQTTRKTEDGKSYYKKDYAYTPDDVPSHWKLRLVSTPGGKPDPRIVGAAVAALGPGFRGQKVQIPRADLPAVKRRVLRAWHAANPGKETDDIPDVLKHLGSSMEGVAPPGWEHSIQQMKKDIDIDNPFALSWWLKNRGATPAQHATTLNAAAETLLRGLKRQQAQVPALCLAASRGESWAQVQLLDPQCAPILIEGRW